MKLICFPYAGATSAIFMKWKEQLGEIKIVSIDLPGRGRRVAEPLCNTIQEMVDDMEAQMLALINQEESYAVYGHSMGTLLIYELLHKLMEKEIPMPVHIFLSGKNPPHIPFKKPIHQLPDDEFILKIALMGGMDANFFNDPLLAKIYLPVFRADFKIVETYHYEKKKNQLPVDITFFFASDDNTLSSKYVKQWSEYTSGSFRMFYFTGGHFFINERGKQVSEIIKETLLNIDEIIPY